MPDRAPQEQYSDLSVRLYTAVILGAVALFSIWVDSIFFAVFVGALAALMMAELTAIVFESRMRTRLVRVTLVAFAGCVGAGAAVSLPLGAFACMAGLATAMVAGREHVTRDLVVGYLVICAAAAALDYLRHVPGGFWVVVWITGCVVACDTGAYFAGRTFGGPKLWPAVSPKKTWSGFLGGIALAFFVTGLLALWWGGSAFYAAALGGGLAAISVGGDLTESSLKRRYGVKDSGKTLPGHGGLLDRFDGFIAALIAAALFHKIFDLATLTGAALMSGGA